MCSTNIVILLKENKSEIKQKIQFYITTKKCID